MQCLHTHPYHTVGTGRLTIVDVGWRAAAFFRCCAVASERKVCSTNFIDHQRSSMTAHDDTRVEHEERPASRSSERCGAPF
tara:strand:+ start:302 stop:544 length:243 start_codon:yes stop_codon:yes gene_type:complete